MIVTGGTAAFSVQMRDGRVISVGFKSSSAAGSCGTITDSTGAAATATPVTVAFPDATGSASSPLTWTRTSGRPIQRADGAVLLPMYGADSAHTGHTIMALTIATPPAGHGNWTFQALRPNLQSPLSAT